MNEKFIFREIIRDMQELADQNGNVLAEEEVRKALEDSDWKKNRLSWYLII